MKIQCDVCNKNAASLYCSADEAALCTSCDRRVHHANKLAGKHPRFSLHHPLSQKDSPVCDICQEKKAFLFCQQDRAILCKDCDVGIHKVNQHIKKHDRFVLTGVKLSPTASLYSDSSSQVALADPDPIVSKTSAESGKNLSGHEPTTSSISEYLIETIPGWHVEDFLDPIPNFSKIGDNDLAPIWGNDLLDGRLNSPFSTESMGMWVPQAPPPAVVPPTRCSHRVQQIKPASNMGFGDQIMNGSSLVFDSNSYNYVNKVTNGTKSMKSTRSSRKWTSDNGNCFMVPLISPPTMAKRSRTLWH